MKSFPFISLVFWTSYLLAATVFADTKTNSIDLTLENAVISNDVQAIIHTLPDIEQLWPQEPATYFRTAWKAAEVLGGAQANPEAKRSLLTLFANVFQKACPTNNAQAVSCFDMKSKTILYFFNFDEFRNDKSQMIAVARFIGEVRSIIIPNYRNRGTGWPGHEILQQAGVMNANAITNPVLKEVYKKAVEDNKDDLIMNDLQSSLRSVNWSITFQLLHNCSRFSSGAQRDDDFIKEIVSSAKLTEDETKKLGAFQHQ
jgi:hypothetical protein